MKVASESSREYFTKEAISLVYEFSNGVPRLINQICDSALLNGFIYGKEVIDKELMREVVRESPMIQIGSQSVKKGVGLDEELKRIVGEK